ncbi:uncharacterized protein [Parasteatoda tepidariorum]|uniref:uncharacterized protein n=1 Tax=Parasteatoda tepidariorum TaxID=114398 RepID=UPI0039BC7986
MARATWGLKPSILKLIYLRATERIILYAASVWYHNTVKINENLKSIRRISLINITKTYSTTSTKALQILAGVKPIHLKILEDTCIKRLKWNWRLNDFDSEVPQILLTAHMDDTPARIHPSKLISVPCDRSLPTNSSLEIFTDGSRMEVANSATDTTEYRTDFGIVTKMYGSLIKEATSTRISNNTSVYMAELVAINNAFLCLFKKEYPDATIYTDSLSSLQALQNPVSNSKIFENTKQLWRSNILCNWVKAHIGTQGNEEADRAAKQATDLCQITLEFPCSIAQIKTQVKLYSMKRWGLEWRSSEKGRQTFKFLKIPKLNRLQANFYLNQFLTGHGVFGEHQYKLFHKTPECNYCGKYQSIDHLLMNCSQFQTIRGNNVNNIGQHQCYASLTCRDIIKKIIKQTLEDVLGDGL